MHREGKSIFFQPQFQAHFRSARVLDDIIQSFLKGEEEIVAQFSVHGPGRQGSGQVHTAAQACDAQKIFRKGRSVIHEAAERVVLRINGPDNFVHCASEPPGHVGDLAQVIFLFQRRFTLRQFAQ